MRSGILLQDYDFMIPHAIKYRAKKVLANSLNNEKMNFGHMSLNLNRTEEEETMGGDLPTHLRWKNT